MCEASPGLRCAADTGCAAESTAKAYYDTFGDDAPPIHPVSSATEEIKRVMLEVTTRGESGYLVTNIRGQQVRYGLTLDPRKADLYAESRAPRAVRKAEKHFDAVEIVPYD